MNRTFSLTYDALFILLSIILLTVFGSIPVLAAPEMQEEASLSTPELINRAADVGRIDVDTANLYIAYALGNHERLPQEYRSNVPWDGTLTLLKLQQALKTETAGRFKAEIAAILEIGSCNSSSGILPNVWNSTYFHIEYNTIGGGLTILDYATSLDAAWTKQVTNFGWAAPPVLTSNPPPPLDNRYHVRIDSLGAGLYGYVSSSGVHSGFVGDNPNTAWNDIDAYASCMVLNRDYSTFAGTPQQAMDATIAHEFNHSIQFGYGVLSGSNVPATIFVEGGATWMEDEVFDSSNDNYNYLWPNFSLPMGNYTASPYRYWITFRGMTERYGAGSPGAGEQVMQDFWETLSQGSSGNGIAALNTALGNRGTNLNDAFHAYAIAVKFNKTCGSGYVHPYCFEEAAGYVSARGATVVNGSIGSIGGNYTGSIADSYAINWVSLPVGSTSYKVTLQNTSAGGSLRGSIVCDTGLALNITAFPTVAGTGAMASIANFNPTGCSSVVAVITNQSTATTSTVRSYNLTITEAGPPIATLVSPSGNIGENYNPTYTWNKVTEATWYYLYVNGPSGNLIKQWYQSSAVCGASTCSATPSTTLGGGAHTWWVQTYNASGYGPWSVVMSFTTTSPTPPGAATLVSPTGNIGSNYMPTYSWNHVAARAENGEESAATWYYLWVNGPSGNLIAQWYQASAVCSGGTCSATPTISLGDGTFTWWVRSYNQAGYGPWSAGMEFSTTIPPGAAALISPSGDIGENYNPTYTWNKVTSRAEDGEESAATWYYLWVNGPSGNVIATWYDASICGASTCSVTPGTTLGGGAHTWWVRTWNATGYGPWSAGMDFSTTIPTPPGAATLVSPSSSIATYTPTYIWNHVTARTESGEETAATWYQLYVSGTYGIAINQWYQASAVCSGGTCSVTPTVTLQGGTHTWWVRSYNQAGYGPWSSAMNFSLPPGFNSQFNSDALGWQSHSGTWWIHSNQWYTTTGLERLISSISFKTNFTTLDYQARLFNGGEWDDEACLAVRGTPDPLDERYYWNSYYKFCYTVDGYYIVWKRVNGSLTLMQNYTYSPYINTNNAWNEFRVVASSNSLYFYINGNIVWTGSDSSLSSGRVGIEYLHSNYLTAWPEQLWVDWATLTTSVPRITDTISPEQQAWNDMAERGASDRTAPPGR